MMKIIICELLSCSWNGSYIVQKSVKWSSIAVQISIRIYVHIPTEQFTCSNMDGYTHTTQYRIQ